MTPIELIAVALTVLQFLDGWTTYQSIKYGAREANPVIRWVIERTGKYGGLLASKGAAVALVWFIALNPDKWTLEALIVVAVLYVLVAAHNYNTLYKLKETDYGK